MLILISLEFLT